MIGFGTWDIRGEAGKQSILTALDLGYRLIDTAQMYENENIVGCAVKESGIPREELFLTTKIYRPRTTYQKAKSGIEQSLNELQTDYIDLLLIHEPYKSAPEMYEAFKEALRDGKVRAIGISNFDAEKYKEFVRSCEIIPAVNQVESHVYFPQLELKNLLNSYGTQMQSWASFTEGRKNIFEGNRRKARQDIRTDCPSLSDPEWHCRDSEVRSPGANGRKSGCTGFCTDSVRALCYQQAERELFTIWMVLIDRLKAGHILPGLFI